MGSTQTALATREEREQQKELRAELTRYAPSFAKVLPAHLTPERLVTLTLVAATKTPKLFDCSPESIALAVIRVGQWGLDIGTTAHLVPFNDKQANGGRGGLVCTPIADWKGKIELMYRGGIVRKVTPRAVYANEHFLVRYGLDEMLEHHPIVGSDTERGPFVKAYTIAWLRGGATEFEVMSREQIEKIRQGAVSKDSPAWRGHFDEMGKKTTVHRLAKRLPQSPQLRDAIGAEEGLDGIAGMPADPALAAERERLLEVAATHQRALPARGHSMTWQHAPNGDVYDARGPQAEPASGAAQGAPALAAARPTGADPYGAAGAQGAGQGEPALVRTANGGGGLRHERAVAPAPAAEMTLEQAKAVPLRGAPDKWGGNGRKPIGEVDSKVLTAALDFFTEKAMGASDPKLDEQVEAIALVLADRERDQTKLELDAAAPAPVTGPVSTPEPGKVQDALALEEKLPRALEDDDDDLPF